MKSIRIHPAEIVKEITRNYLGGLNVVFINMPLRESARPNVTPEGPLLLATNLRDNYRVDATIIDLNAYRIKDVLWQKRVNAGEKLPWGRHKTFEEAKELIEKHFQVYGEPDLIGFSGKITTLRWQRKIAKIVRMLLPNVFLVSGGGLATELKAGLFNYINELDGVAHSEGDDVIIKIAYDAKVIKEMGFAQAVNSGKLAPYYMGEIVGRHRFVYAGNRPKNLNSLPFANLELLRSDVFGNPLLEWYLNTPAWSRQASNSSAIPWNDEDVIPKTTSVSSRGCPFGCKYCFKGSQGERKWGPRSAVHVYAEMLYHIEKYGIKFKSFGDDNFAVAVQRITDMVSLIGPLKIPWGTHTRLDEIAGIISGKSEFENPRRVELMAKAGCQYIGFGPESASPKVLEALGKGGHTLTNGMMEVAVNGRTHSFPTSMVVGIKNALEFGIHSNCTWIFGSPTETIEDVKKTVLFMLWQLGYYTSMGLPSDSINTKMFTLTWYPGTTIINYEKVRQELKRVFGLNCLPARPNANGVLFEPVFDNNFLKYMLELDDATKVLYGIDNEPLNFSDMATEEFLQAREYIDTDQTFKIIEMC